MRLPLYIEVSLWDRGEVIGCWTTETPGRTGPVDMSWRECLHLARRGWRLRLRRRTR